MKNCYKKTYLTFEILTFLILINADLSLLFPKIKLKKHQSFVFFYVLKYEIFFHIEETNFK